MSVDKSLSALWSKSLGLMFLGEIQFWKCQCAQVLSVAESQLFCLCTHSLHHPWLSTEGSGNRTEGSGLHPLWSEGVRRIGCIVCCAETWGGTSRAWDIILWHPTLRGPLGSPPCSTAFPHHAVFASWVDGCAAPLLRWHLDRCGDAVKQRDTFF